ncbi:MAG: S-layer homology domain-containing protein [Candidatus Peregrinibacteria bacterium]
MNSKITHSLLFSIGCLLVVLPTMGFARFPDVSRKHPYAKAITFLAEQKILTGFADGTFKPDQTVTRAELATILIRGYSSEQCTLAPGTFKDIPAESNPWYGKYVCEAEKLQLLKGYPDHTLKPDAPVTFAEAAAMIARGFNLNGYVGGELIWYKPGISSLSARKAIPISIKDLNQPVTRGEIAEIFYRIQHTNATRIESIILSSPLDKAPMNEWLGSYPKAFDAPSTPYQDLVPVAENIRMEHPEREHNFVRIYGTVTDRMEANREARTIDGWVLSTDETEKLTPHLYAVVTGPYASQKEAEDDWMAHSSMKGQSMYIKDAGKFLWPADSNLSQTDFPPGLLQAVIGFTGLSPAGDITLTTALWKADIIEWFCDPQGPAYEFTFSTSKPFSLMGKKSIQFGSTTIETMDTKTLTLHVRDSGKIEFTGDWACFD